MSWSHRCSMRCSMHLNPCKSLTYSFTRLSRHFESAPVRQAAYCLEFLVMCSGVISENQSDPKRLFSTVNKLLHRRDDVCLPTSDKSSLVSAFADHFRDKILSIKLGLCSLKSDRGIESTVSDLSCGSNLTEFNPVSPDKLSQLLGGSGLKVCSLNHYQAF